MTEPTIAFDDNGHLHVKSARISRAGIAPYKGDELRELRVLAPQKTFSVLRSANELKKAAKTFNDLPILRDHASDAVEIGRTGRNAHFADGFLCVDIVVTDEAAIADIRSGRARALSIGYDYAIHHQSGVSADHGRFEKIMHGIVGNHVAVVDATRAGPECSIPKIQTERNLPMAFTTGNGATPAARAYFSALARAREMALDGIGSNTPALNSAHESKKVRSIVGWAVKNMTDEEMVALAEQLQRELEGRPATQQTSPRHAHDSGSRNYGNPRPTRLTTEEVKAFAARVRVDTVGVQPPAKKTPAPTSQAVSNFGSRYPSAGKIKLL